LAPPPPLPVASSVPSHGTEVEHEKDDAPDFPDTETSSERLTIRRYHPRAPQPQQHPGPISPQGDSEEPPASLRGDEDDDAPQYVGRVHQFPTRSTRSGPVRNAGGSGALLAFGAFEGLEPAFAPTLTTPDPQTTRDALRAPDANDWRAAMDAEIDNMRRLNVFKEVPRPSGKNITPKWVFRRKYENGSLTKYKARLVARGFTQVSGVDYREAHLYAPVVLLESFRALISIAALFDHDLRQFDVSAAYLHGGVDGEAYGASPRV